MSRTNEALGDPQAEHRKILYIEPFSGISGDMMIGALLDLGTDFEHLQQQLRLLPLKDYQLSYKDCLRSGIHAKKFDVQAEEFHTHRHFKEIRDMIESSGLSPWVKEKSVAAFRKLAQAEGKVHNRPPEKVSFHEVGAVDSIIDIVGSMIALEGFLPVRIISSSVNVGQGTLECQHGIYPVPGPATQELLEGVPCFSNTVNGELTTPTGATLLITLAEHFGPRPAMRMLVSGYGAGTRETPGNANVLRITLGEEMVANVEASPEEVVAVIEATVDDMSPQIYGYFQEKALAAGALDVYATPIQMKKNRPGFKLTVLCALEQLDSLAQLTFRETTTIGLRHTIAHRKTLQRESMQVQTEYGAVTIKISSLHGRRLNFIPEYEDCRRLACEKGVALKEVQAAAIQAYRQANQD